MNPQMTRVWRATKVLLWTKKKLPTDRNRATYGDSIFSQGSAVTYVEDVPSKRHEFGHSS